MQSVGEFGVRSDLSVGVEYVVAWELPNGKGIGWQGDWLALEVVRPEYSSHDAGRRLRAAWLRKK